MLTPRGEMTWRRPGYCYSGECAEVARDAAGMVRVRDSADPAGLELAFTAAEWAAFTAAVRAGEHG